jgi:nitroimidazol reductase NimA-like FMN-containing flavoprotein (pyridoxamine 5'-phosphate oxidase superfamily)
MEDPILSDHHSYHIGTVSRLTALRAETIRAWERRHRAVTPLRTPGGTRLFSEEDVRRLGLMKALTERGDPISAIAGLSAEALRWRLARIEQIEGERSEVAASMPLAARPPSGDPMSLAMTRTEREAFLADVHVGVISVAEPGRGPLTVPIWYGYAPGGELWIVTERGSRKGRLLEKTGRFSLVAQSEKPPYRYVSVEGPIVSIEKSVLARDERPLAHRYLGAEFGERYLEATGGEDARGDNVVVRMRPERWLSVDYSKQYAG